MKVKRLAETPPQTLVASSSSSFFTTLGPDVIHTHILTRLDVESLLALSRSSSELRRLCGDEKLWRKICTSKWPSLLDPIASDVITTFPGGHRSFFLDVFLSLTRANLYPYHPSPPPAELILAVDIYFQQGPAFFSTVERINNTTPFLRSYEVKSPVSVHIDDQPVEGKYEEWFEDNMRLSWIVIDPSRKRAVNLSRSYDKTIVFKWHGSEFMVPCWVGMMGDKTVGCDMKVDCRWNPLRNLLCVSSVTIMIILRKSVLPVQKEKNTTGLGTS